MNIIESLNWRYAAKEFNEKKISDTDVNIIAESLRLSASSFGLQPWKFLIISDQEVQNSLIEHSWGQKQVANCSHLIVLCTPEDFNDQNVDDYINDTAKTRDQSAEDLEGYSKMMKGFLSSKDINQKQVWMKDQVYIALGNLLTTCAVMNIDSCPMEGIVQNKYDEILNLKSKGLKSIVACPIGYRSENDKYATAKKVRFPLEKVVEFI